MKIVEALIIRCFFGRSPLECGHKKPAGRDGTYFLRTNQTGKDGAELWQEYMLQCNVEQAFRELKSDLGIRPI